MAPTGENTTATRCPRSRSGEDVSTGAAAGSIDASTPGSVPMTCRTAPTRASLAFVKGDNSPKNARTSTTKARQMRYPITCLMGAHTSCCRPQRRGRYPGKHPEIFNLSKHPHTGSRPSVFSLRYYPRILRGYTQQQPFTDHCPKVYRKSAGAFREL